MSKSSLTKTLTLDEAHQHAIKVLHAAEQRRDDAAEALAEQQETPCPTNADDIVVVAQAIVSGAYMTTPNIRQLARDYIRLRALANRPQPSEKPHDAGGRLLLNAYGRECYEAGQKSVAERPQPYNERLLFERLSQGDD